MSANIKKFRIKLKRYINIKTSKYIKYGRKTILDNLNLNQMTVKY